MNKTSVSGSSESSSLEINGPPLLCSLFCSGCGAEEIKNQLVLQQVVLVLGWTLQTTADKVCFLWVSGVKSTRTQNVFVQHLWNKASYQYIWYLSDLNWNSDCFCIHVYLFFNLPSGQIWPIHNLHSQILFFFTSDCLKTSTRCPSLDTCRLHLDYAIKSTDQLRVFWSFEGDRQQRRENKEWKWGVYQRVWKRRQHERILENDDWYLRLFYQHRWYFSFVVAALLLSDHWRLCWRGRERLCLLMTSSKGKPGVTDWKTGSKIPSHIHTLFTQMCVSTPEDPWLLQQTLKLWTQSLLDDYFSFEDETPGTVWHVFQS